MNLRYPAISRRAGRRCEYCHAPAVVFNFAFEVEHIIPVSAGGADDEANLALACRSCNVHKGSRLTAPDPDTGTGAPLFHPREQTWADHFVLDFDAGAVRGRTPTGRATAEALRMNDPVQLVARQLWMQLRLYP